MKLIHLSDLHLGKRVNGFPMIEDQTYILTKIINVIDEEKPDGILIAGDVYDKPIPPAEAVELFDDFLVRLAKRELPVFIISGNHDSPERLAFGNRLMDRSGVHFAPVYNGEIRPFTLEDEFGAVDIWLLPFLKPTHVRHAFPEAEIESYTDAMRTAIAAMPVDESRRNILVTHQFVTGAERSESEEIAVGGADNVDAGCFSGFDYVALGHLHGPQNVGSERIRYCGTPLKYSFSETKHEKSVTVLELAEKGKLTVRTVRLIPKRDLVELRGTYDELTRKAYYEGTSWQEDYTHITLTDEEDIPEALARLRSVYHNLMKLDYDNRRTRQQAEIRGAEDVENKTPLELFAELFRKQNNSDLSEEQTAFLTELIEKIWEDEK
ncbi:MAG: exonuclease SbcCD subunit D [Firmicutes bacterium]|nr:exonuclease SbcCD subunit D [Bacillota bacterium]